MRARVFFLLVFLVGTVISPQALEVGVLFRMENLNFRTDRDIDNERYSGTDLFWGASVVATHDLSDSLSLEGGFVNDPVLRNLAYTLFSFHAEYFSIGVGPFFGFFNASSTLLKSGISTSVRVDWPGVSFIILRSDSSIGGRLIDEGDYIQERNDVALGFYVPNAICSLNLQTKKFTQKLEDYEVVDGLTEYAFKTDIFQKNHPYRILLSFAYQTLSKEFVVEGEEEATHTLSSLILGTELNFQVNDFLRLLFNLESAVYTFGQDELFGISNPGPLGYMFRLYAGCSLNFDKLR